MGALPYKKKYLKMTMQRLRLEIVPDLGRQLHENILIESCLRETLLDVSVMHK